MVLHYVTLVTENKINVNKINLLTLQNRILYGITISKLNQIKNPLEKIKLA